MNAAHTRSGECLPIGVPAGTRYRVGDRTFQPLLHDPRPPGGCFIEEMYWVQVCYDTGEVKRWTFDDLGLWLRERGFRPSTYERILRAAIALDRRLWKEV
mgnify:FL=1